MTTLARNVSGALMLICSAVTAAQGYPSRPIRLVVGFTAGGSADSSARMIAGAMAKTLGTTIVVENRGGAAGSVAAQIVSKATPDGHTLLWSSPGALTINRILEKSLPYNPDTAFVPIGLALTFCNALVARQESPVNSVAQLIAAAKEKPGYFNFATQGVGSAGHLSSELLRSMTGISMTHIPYKGGADIVTAMLGGEIQLAFMSSTTARAVRHRIKILAVTSLKRDLSLPEVPSMDEAGIKNYDASFWFGLLAPAGTPPAIVNTINKHLHDALADPGVTKVVESQGLNPAHSTPSEFADRIKAEYAKWRKVLGA